jgi:hypothetical protein
MGGKNKQVAVEVGAQMPSGGAPTSTPQAATCHPGGRPVISVSTTSIDFGKSLVGDAVSKTFTVSNTGSADLTGIAVTVTQGTGSWNVGALPKTALKPGESMTVTVTLPGQASGKIEGKLSIDSNASNGKKSVALKAVVFALKEVGPKSRFLATEADDEDFKIQYQIDGSGAVDEGSITVLDKDDGPVWTRALTESERASKLHRIAWKGHLGGSNYLNVVGSPYKLRVAIKISGAQKSAQVEYEVKVEAHSIEIALGDKRFLQQAMDKAVYDQIVADGGLPKGTALRKVYLPSNWFSSGPGDKAHNNNTSFAKYLGQWGGGPAIPLIATVWLKTSASAAKMIAPRGLGTARVLWDFKDETEDTSTLSSPVRSFVEDALNWCKDSTEPPGDNCAGPSNPALDCGGKRSEDASVGRPVLRTSGQHTDGDRSAAATLVANFPFTSTRARNRRWAVYGDVETTRENWGKAGIVFQPSRMAGDSYSVHAWLDLAGELDRKGDLQKFVDQNAPDKHKSSSTGVFQMWRELHIMAITSKNGNNVHEHSKVVPYYEKAYIRLVDKTKGKIHKFDKSRYNRVFKDALDTFGRGNDTKVLFQDYAVDDAEHQFKDSTAALRMHSHDKFLSDVLDMKVPEARVDRYLRNNLASFSHLATDDEKWDAANEELRDQERGALALNGWTDPADDTVGRRNYWKKVQEMGRTIAKYACDFYMEPDRIPGEGVAVFVFAWSVNLWRSGYDGIRGTAMNTGPTPG